MDVHNNRLIIVYKSKSDIYYVVTAHPGFLNGELLSDRCTVFTDTAGLLMQYDSEEEAEESIKDWLDRMVVGYQEGDLIKIANPKNNKLIIKLIHHFFTFNLFKLIL